MADQQKYTFFGTFIVIRCTDQQATFAINQSCRLHSTTTMFAAPYRDQHFIIHKHVVHLWVVFGLFIFHLAIFKNWAAFRTASRYGFGGFVMAACYYTLNQIFEGFLNRNFTSQFFISNILAAFTIYPFTVFYQSRMHPSQLNKQFRQAEKYTLVLCAFSLFVEILINYQRNYYLNYQQTKVIQREKDEKQRLMMEQFQQRRKLIQDRK